MARFGFEGHCQRGSHVKLRHVTASGIAQTLTIPTRREMDIGTLRAILRQASHFVPEDERNAEFYSE